MRKLSLLIAISALSCGKTDEMKQKASGSIVESVLESATGIDADTKNIQNSESNKATLDFKDEGINLNKRFQNGFGTITATSQSIAITVTGGENGQDNLLIGFTGNDLTQNHPLKAKMNNPDGNSMSFSTADYSNNGMDMMISYEAEGEIIQFKPEKTVIKIKGKMGYAADADKPEKWRQFEGVFTLNYPVFQAMGNSKEDFIY